MPLMKGSIWLVTWLHRVHSCRGGELFFCSRAVASVLRNCVCILWLEIRRHDTSYLASAGSAHGNTWRHMETHGGDTETHVRSHMTLATKAFINATGAAPPGTIFGEPRRQALGLPLPRGPDPPSSRDAELGAAIITFWRI
ncbi:hypothetical protein F4859DRAFT_203559 [Xylaria cf. heliscus]|nr:hypothetical protein F4859DRAFT_203559 [Xylaria cf. heliscus]